MLSLLHISDDSRTWAGGRRRYLKNGRGLWHGLGQLAATPCHRQQHACKGWAEKSVFTAATVLCSSSGAGAVRLIRHAQTAAGLGTWQEGIAGVGMGQGGTYPLPLSLPACPSRLLLCLINTVTDFSLNVTMKEKMKNLRVGLENQAWGRREKESSAPLLSMCIQANMAMAWGFVAAGKGKPPLPLSLASGSLL